MIIEIDVGLHRSGVRTAAEVVALGRQATDAPGLRLRGLLGYEGTACSSPTARCGSRKPAPITELHARSYIFSDAFRRDLVPGFEPALTVLDLPPGSGLAVGDRVELMPGYSPTTVNFYDV